MGSDDVNVEDVSETDLIARLAMKLRLILSIKSNDTDGGLKPF